LLNFGISNVKLQFTFIYENEPLFNLALPIFNVLITITDANGNSLNILRTKLGIINFWRYFILQVFSNKCFFHLLRVVVVGIQPEVAFSMIQLGIHIENANTALDLDEGLKKLKSIIEIL
jgi:hypothetical protein